MYGVLLAVVAAIVLQYRAYRRAAEQRAGRPLPARETAFNFFALRVNALGLGLVTVVAVAAALFGACGIAVGAIGQRAGQFVFYLAVFVAAVGVLYALHQIRRRRKENETANRDGQNLGF